MAVGAYGYKKVIKWLPLLSLVCLGCFCWSMSVFAADFGFTLDFEEGNLRGWRPSGTAFRSQPTLGDNPTFRGRGQLSRHQGRYWIGTFENYQGKQGQRPGGVQEDGPTGVLTSKEFIIPEGTLSFLIGGGSDVQRLGVGLWVKVRQTPEFNADRMQHAVGRNLETMQRVTWDLTPYAGKSGFIQIVDASSSGWGHINVDDFRFSARATITPSFDSPPAVLVARTRVPSLVGRHFEEAKELLAEAHLSVGGVDKEESGRRSGTVLAQAPKPGTLLSWNASVRMVIAVAEHVRVPALVGKDIGVGEQLLVNKKLGFGRVERKLSTEKSNLVLDQKPAAGVRVPVGTRVDVLVSRQEFILVPDLTGRNLEQAGNILEQQGLSSGRVRSRPSSRREGTVLSQSPRSGERVQRGAVIDLLIAEVGMVFVPDLLGQSIQAAESLVVRGRLKFGGVQKRESLQKEWTVLAQRPDAGAEVRPDSEVVVIVATPVIITVPDITGLTLERAEDVLQKVGLRKGPVENRLVPRSAGTVLKQEPGSGTRVAHASQVRLVVSERELPATMPNLVGFSLKRATKILEELHLPIRRVTHERSDNLPGTVLNQEPVAGVSLRVGAAVSLVVAKEKESAIPWVGWSVSLLAGGVVCGLFFRRLRQRFLKGRGTKLSIRTRKDFGRQKIVSEGLLFKEGKMCIRAVRDPGEKRCQAAGSLFKQTSGNGEHK